MNILLDRCITNLKTVNNLFIDLQNQMEPLSRLQKHQKKLKNVKTMQWSDSVNKERIN